MTKSKRTAADETGDTSRQRPKPARTLAVRLFGQLELVVDGRPFRLSTPRKTLQVLAYLLLNRAAPVSREYLAFLLWPDDEEGSARTKLRATLADLRKVMPQPFTAFIDVDADALSWNAALSLRLDTQDFEAAARAPSRIREALDLYRGDLLPELYDEWLYAVRERYRNTYLRCLEELVSEARRNSDFALAIETARKILAIDQWREDIVRRIIVLRYELGDRAGAMSEYVRFAERLRHEIGVEPMPETVATAERIGRGELIAHEPEAQSRDAEAKRPEVRESSPLFGRAGELERLRQAWVRAKQGRGGIVFLGGEPGIGKSRLARELMYVVEEDGGRVLSGATGAPESFPYQGIVEALRAGLPLVAALQLGETWFAALAALLPELSQRVGTLPALPTLDAVQQRLRLFEAVARALIALARTRPLLLVLEDLHWASQATFDAIAFIVRQSVAARVLIVGTFRDDEAHRRHPLRRLQRESELQGSASTLSLPPLDLDAVTEIVRRTPDIADPSRFAGAVFERSGGNPLFLSQLLTAPAAALSAATPPTIASLVGARIATLSDRARTFAEIAALSGERFAVDVVRDVAGWDDAAALAAIDELLDRRLVGETTGRGIFRYGFAHQLVQQAIVELSPPESLRERNRRTARVLSELYPERAEELAADIARHLEHGGEPAAAAERYLIAARRALDLGAIDETRRNVQRGLNLASDTRLRSALVQVSEIANARGADVRAQATDQETLAKLADELDDDDLRRSVLLRRLRLAVAYSQSEAHAIAAELERRARASHSLAWEAAAALGQVLLLDLDLSVAEGIRASRRAAAAYARLGDDASHANALASLARSLSQCGEDEEARAISEQAVALAKKSGSYEATDTALRLASGVAIEAGDRARVSAWCARWLHHSIAAGDRREEANALIQSAWPLADGPRCALALPILERAGSIADEWNLRRLRVNVDVNVAEVWTKLGAFDRAIAILEGAVAYHALNSIVHASGARSGFAMALAHGGQPERAAEVGHQAIQGLEASGRTARLPLALENLAEAEWLCGRPHVAEELLERALGLRRSRRLRPSSPRDAALLALLRLEMDDLSGARAWAARVSDDEANLGADWPWPQRSAWAAAYVYHRCGEDALATAWLRRAHDIYSAHLPSLDETQRDVFAALPWHRSLLAAHAGRWPKRHWD